MVCGRRCPCSPETRMNILLDLPLFAGVPHAALSEINNIIRADPYSDGATIYRAEDPGSRMYIVASGAVKLTRGSHTGSDVLLEIIASGGSFGAMDPSVGKYYRETACSVGDSCVLTFSGAESQRLLRHHPSIALAALEDLTLRLDNSHRVIRQLSTDTVEQRLAATLLALETKFGTSTDERSRSCRIPLSRSELASMAATTPESASRVISHWRKAGLVVTGRRWTTINDKPALRAIAGRHNSRLAPTGSPRVLPSRAQNSTAIA